MFPLSRILIRKDFAIQRLNYAAGRCIRRPRIPHLPVSFSHRVSVSTAVPRCGMAIDGRFALIHPARAGWDMQKSCIFCLQIGFATRARWVGQQVPEFSSAWLVVMRARPMHAATWALLSTGVHCGLPQSLTLSGKRTSIQ